MRLILLLFVFISFNSIAQREYFKLSDSTLEVGKVFIAKNVFFEYNRHQIRPESNTQLDSIFNFLKDHENLTIEIGVHTDSRGSDSYGSNPSQKRAQSLADYFINKGLQQDRFLAKGYGESQPLNHCVNGVKCSDEEHAVNRRTELKILAVE